MATLEELKQLLYLDGTADDVLLQSYIDAADQFVKGAVGDDESFWEDSHVKPLYNAAVKSLAATWYQNRLALSDTQTYEVDLTLHSILGQLRGWYAVKVGDDDETTNKPAQSSN